ncbi:MAG: MotA/TolQ/ExbB proton channel family protein [Gammaproteobacteria bacterium]|nr:MotA/TolQ/ExbB proton channel family protein [Gammaproteobacteria bacterium]
MQNVQIRYGLFLQWLLLFGLMLFASWLLWDQALLQKIVATDNTRITLIIIIIFIAATGHCAARSLYLSKEQMALDQIVNAAEKYRTEEDEKGLWVNHQVPSPWSLSGQLVSGVLARQGLSNETETKPDNQLLAQVMSEQARGQHEVGWFISGVLIKLGLLGTVVGFVLMLAPVAELESFDLSDIQGLLQRMTTGMSIALNTTLTGLSCSMLLGLQYLILDRAADDLVARAVHFTETRLTNLAGKE